MALKFVLDSLEGLDEAHVPLYSKHTDGKFYLDVDGAVAKSRLDEFRDNNVNLKKDNETLTAKFGNIDLERYQELMDKDALDDGKKRITMDKVDGIVSERTSAMKTEYETQLGNKDGIIANQGKQLNSLLVDGAVRTASIEAKIRTSAVDDVVLRAQSVFKVVDGKAVAHDADGNTMYGKNGSDPLSMAEWVTGLKGSAEHLFEQSKGGGASGGAGGDVGAGGVGGGGGNQDATTMSPLAKISAGMKAAE